MTNETITIKNRDYQLLIQYQNEEKYRKELNRLTQLVFEYDFENFYQSGYWDETCVMYSIFDQDKLVSNLNVILFRVTIAAEQKTMIHLDTVMTDESHQGKGLSRFLMERVLADYGDKVDGFFLFANDSVLDFYPKFGFSAVTEYQASGEFKILKNNGITKRKLDLDLQEDRQLMEGILRNTVPCSTLQMDNFGFTFFYCLAIPDFGWKDAIYYLDGLEALVIAELEDQVLYIFKIFSKKELALEEVLKAFSDQDVRSFKLGFSPKGTDFHFEAYRDQELTLFVSEALLSLFRENKCMIPMLSRI